MRLRPDDRRWGQRKVVKKFLLWPLELANEQNEVSCRWLEWATVEYRRYWNYFKGFYWQAVRFIDGSVQRTA